MTSNKRFKIFYFSLFLVGFILSGCFKQPAPVYYYTLASTSSAQVSTGSADPTFVSLPNILLGPIHVASFLDQRQLVTQKSAYSLTLAEQHRWAGDLPEMITDVLHSNLSIYLNSEKIHPFPDRNSLQGLQLELHFLHFEENENGLAKTAARWKIISTETHEILHTETTTCTIDPETKNYDGLVKGLSQGLSLLSDTIATKIINL